MSENLFIPTEASKAEKYEAILPQIEALISGEPDLYANLANISAVLKQGFDFFWVGFYLVKEEQLVLDHSKGPSHVQELLLEKVSAGRLGKKEKRDWFLMWMLFQGILPAAQLVVRRSWFLF